MQTDSIDVGDTSPSNHWILYFTSTKFHPKFSGKDGITFELKALCHMSLTNVQEIFFCNTRKHGGKQFPSIFLTLSFRTLSFLFGLYFFQKMSSGASSIEANYFLPYIAQVNFSMALKVVWTSLSRSNGTFKTGKAFLASSLLSSNFRGWILPLRLNEAVLFLPVNAWNPGSATQRLLISAWCNLFTFTYLSVLFVWIELFVLFVWSPNLCYSCEVPI